jgi:hypothetical protein
MLQAGKQVDQKGSQHVCCESLVLDKILKLNLGKVLRFMHSDLLQNE